MSENTQQQPAGTAAAENDDMTIGDWLSRQQDFDAGMFGTEDAGDATGPDGQPWDHQRYMSTLHKVQQEAKTAKAERQTVVDALVQAGIMPKPADNTPPTAAQLRDYAAKATAQAREAQVQLAVFTNAGSHGADPAKVLGWAPFLESVKGLDPAAADFKAQVAAKIGEHTTASPWLRADGAPATQAPAPASVTTPAPGVSGGQFTAGHNPAPITEAELARMSQAEVAKAFHEGRLTHLMG
ncbi:hypothetical protein [Dactylosporangium sp. CS-033363]|uniref:hypothetical protein n=1 Tax=Dactylosporangium sp. CS-033363 TaxID=3239935 RepID=UPI003D8D2CF8